MHQGAVQSSPAQQMVAAGGPSWWSINGLIPPLPQYSASPPLYHNFPHHHHHHQLSQSSSLVAPLSSSWNDDQEIIPHLSCSQLLLGGLVGGEDKPPGLRTLENWEQQLLNLTSNSGGGSSSDYSAGGHENNADQFQPPPSGSWTNLMAPAASSPTSCLTTFSNNMVDYSPKSSELKHQRQDPSPDQCNSIGTTTTGGAAKKARIQPPSAQSTFKVRKEKLGDRITALHQLVSPFGKTDTASVLLEAIGYIRFLQSQIEALSLPYLGSKSGCIRQHLPAESEKDEKNKLLRNRGLCLVPVSCTQQMESDNGADYWAPGFGANIR